MEENNGIEKVIISGPKHVEIEYFHILLSEWRIPVQDKGRKLSLRIFPFLTFWDFFVTRHRESFKRNLNLALMYSGSDSGNFRRLYLKGTKW